MFTAIEIAAAFGGGIFGSAFGAVPAFIMAGLLVLGNLPDVAFGPFFGPHISFGAAVVATAFAAKRGLDSGKDILAPLIKINDGLTLLVGGIFGIFGLVVQKLLVSVATPTDTVALTVVISHVIARLIFGNRQLFAGYKFPDSRTAGTLVVLGLGVGLASGYVTMVTKNPVLTFGIAAVSLIVLQFMGVGPVTHHLALPAAVAVGATGSIWVAGLFGILGALLGDFFTQTMNNGDTHVDPPALTIALLTTVVLLFLQ